MGPLIATRQSRIASSVCCGQERAVGLEGAGARGHLDPLDPDVGRIEDQSRRGRDLGADPVAGDENDPVCHRSSTLPGPSAVAPRAEGVTRSRDVRSSARRGRSRRGPRRRSCVGRGHPRPRAGRAGRDGCDVDPRRREPPCAGAHAALRGPGSDQAVRPVPPVAATGDRRRRRSTDHVGRRAAGARAGVLGVRARRLRSEAPRRRRSPGGIRARSRVAEARRYGLPATTVRGSPWRAPGGKAARRPRNARTGSRASLPGSPS